MGIYDRDYMRRDYVPPERRKKPPPTRGMPYWGILVLGILLIVGGIVMVVRLGNSHGSSKITVKTTVEPSAKQVETPGLLDVNSATYEQLRTIPFMTDATAKSLIQLRPFKKWDELDAVYGIGPKRLDFFRDYLLLEAPAAVTQETASP